MLTITCQFTHIHTFRRNGFRGNIKILTTKKNINDYQDHEKTGNFYYLFSYLFPQIFYSIPELLWYLEKNKTKKTLLNYVYYLESPSFLKDNLLNYTHLGGAKMAEE